MCGYYLRRVEILLSTALFIFFFMYNRFQIFCRYPEAKIVAAKLAALKLQAAKASFLTSATDDPLKAILYEEMKSLLEQVNTCNEQVKAWGRRMSDILILVSRLEAGSASRPHSFLLTFFLYLLSLILFLSLFFLSFSFSLFFSLFLSLALFLLFLLSHSSFSSS